MAGIAGLGFIDPRVKIVGVSYLRNLNADSLDELKDNLLLVQVKDEPVAVVVSYETWMRVQELAKRGE